MSTTLTPEQEHKLKARAERAHKSMDAVLDDLLSDSTEIQNGATYPTFPPDDNPGAASVMQQALADESSKQPVPDAESLALIAMLRQWREEDEQMTEEEIEQATRDYEELRTSLNINRIRAGEEPLYP